jgi:ribonucleoside-diphosphate reductase alpha chain
VIAKEKLQSEVALYKHNEGYVKVVKKRDGRVEQFSPSKVYNSIEKAFEISNAPKELIEEVFQAVLEWISSIKGSIESKQIADEVEKELISRIIDNVNYEKAAKAYVLGRIYNHVFGKGKWRKFNEKDLLLSYNALKVLEARYLIKNPENLRYMETPEMLFRRVARYLAKVEKIYGKSDEEVRKIEDDFYNIISNLEFLPNTPALMNAETRLGILSACFVLPVRDAMSTPKGDGIYDTLRAMALVHQQGGGTGFDFSELRPKGDIVASTAGVASGPVSFMRIFDVSTDVVKQGGKRRGANMGVMHVWHPDIEEFIEAKTGNLKDVHLQNFNISVGAYDIFLRSVEEDKEFPLINPRKVKYLINRARNYMDEQWVQEEIIRELEERGGSVYLEDSRIITLDEALKIAENENAIVRYVNARYIFDKIVKGAWDSGDPGMLFIDEINRRHPAWYLGKINATNPCGEEPLLENESCNLGSINLEKFVKGEGESARIDWDSLAKVIRVALRFLDNVIDANRYPLPEIEKATKLTRKVGLGVMGLARALIKLGIPYDSIDAVFISYQIAKFIFYHAYLASVELAKEKGSFPAYRAELYRDIYDTAKSFDELIKIAQINGKISDRVRKMSYGELDFGYLKQERLKYGIRNATVVSVAPTGTISIIAGTSSSIEPLFALAFVRNVAVGKFIEVDPLFLEFLKKYELDEPEVLKKVSEEGIIGNNNFIPRTLRKLFRTTHEIDYIWHVLHQAAWQQWNDSGTSKTINLRSEEPVETVWKVYMIAWKLGIKGITIYRDKSKSQQVIYFGLKEQKERLKEAKKAETTQITSPLRISKIEVPEDFAGGCPTCDL